MEINRINKQVYADEVAGFNVECSIRFDDLDLFGGDWQAESCSLVSNGGDDDTFGLLSTLRVKGESLDVGLESPIL